MDFTQLVTSLGFPIAACIAMAIFLYKVWNSQQENTKHLLDSLRDEYQAREDKIMAQLGNFANSLQGIDKTLQKLEIRLENLEHKE